jgi:predicted transcriptional regulator
MKLPVYLQAALKAAREKAGKTTSEVAQYLGLALEDYVATEDTLPSDRFREVFAAIKPKLQKIGITVGDTPE